MPTILFDENISGYASLLARILFSPAWDEISRSFDVRLATYDDVGLKPGTTDDQLWEFCQANRIYLLTNNRNEDDPLSLETMIRTRSLDSSVPVFTISDVERLRFERDYAENVAVKLLEYLAAEDNIRGAGRLYLP